MYVRGFSISLNLFFQKMGQKQSEISQITEANRIKLEEEAKLKERRIVAERKRYVEENVTKTAAIFQSTLDTMIPITMARGVSEMIVSSCQEDCSTSMPSYTVYENPEYTLMKRVVAARLLNYKVGVKVYIRTKKEWNDDSCYSVCYLMAKW